ncbi:hypothetical protein [Pseudovibrio sp. Ad37]|uniref:hypothetical protein n=1 Tax=Pseudovibrio sp. Ad37 TaxID=989422 RepID=UPI0007AE431B|nr:hypothetical protein [Pseudovibrio sp. Ad37]
MKINFSAFDWWQIFLLFFFAVFALIFITFSAYGALSVFGVLRGADVVISLTNNFWIGSFGILATLIVAVITAFSVSAIKQQTAKAQEQAEYERHRRAEMYRARLPFDLVNIGKFIDLLAYNYNKLFIEIKRREETSEPDISIEETNDLGFKNVKDPHFYLDTLCGYLEYGDEHIANAIISIMHGLQEAHSSASFNEKHDLVFCANSYRDELIVLAKLKSKILGLLRQMRQRDTEERPDIFQLSFERTVRSWEFNAIVSPEQVQYCLDNHQKIACNQ